MLPLEQTVVWFSFMIATTIFAYRMRVIDRFGAIATVPMGFVILYFGSVLWFFVLLIFFIIASIFTKYKYKQKQKMGLSEGNSGARGWKSVIANGGPGRQHLLSCITYHITTQSLHYLLLDPLVSRYQTQLQPKLVCSAKLNLVQY